MIKIGYWDEVIIDYVDAVNKAKFKEKTRIECPSCGAKHGLAYKVKVTSPLFNFQTEVGISYIAAWEEKVIKYGGTYQFLGFICNICEYEQDWSSQI